MKAQLAISAITLAIIGLLPQTAEARNASRQCQDYAYRASYLNGDGSSAVQGAVGGAIAGAAVGAILGNGQGDSIGRGALVGGVAGTAIGIASNGSRYDRRLYNSAYRSCMNNQADYGFRSDTGYGNDYGHGYAYGHHRGRADRVSFCLSIHPSFNPQTGFYRTHSGAYLACR